MAADPDLVTFSFAAPVVLVDELRVRAVAGGGWANLQAYPTDEEDEEERATSALSRLLGPKGPAAPVCTIVLPVGPGQPLQLGIQHRAGTKVVPLLREAGYLLPGARVRSDHARRGLVVELVTDDLAGTVRWLLDAAAYVSGRPLNDRWQAALYR